MPPEKNDSPVYPDLVRQVLSGETRALARLITLIENDSSRATPYLRELFPHTGKSFVIGITGAPGSGKSSLVDKLAEHFRRRDSRVGIIAVDPTSPFTGGAILGDRIRMQAHTTDPGIFIRSMATRGHLGGLARATSDVLLVLDAAGFEVILVETVGVGQDEVEIVKTAHATLVLLVPGMGDDVQAMKAGIMEIADIFVINKADHPGAERVEAELSALLAISPRADGWKPPVVRTVASEGQGVADCAAALGAYRGFLKSSPMRQDRALQIQKERLLEIARSLVLEPVLRRSGTLERLERLSCRVAQRELDPYSAAEQLLDASD
jgi:LAO/AO transport system kinase